MPTGRRRGRPTIAVRASAFALVRWKSGFPARARSTKTCSAAAGSSGPSSTRTSPSTRKGIRLVARKRGSRIIDQRTELGGGVDDMLDVVEQ